MPVRLMTWSPTQNRRPVASVTEDSGLMVWSRVRRCWAMVLRRCRMVALVDHRMAVTLPAQRVPTFDHRRVRCGLVGFDLQLAGGVEVVECFVDASGADEFGGVTLAGLLQAEHVGELRYACRVVVEQGAVAASGGDGGKIRRAHV